MTHSRRHSRSQNTPPPPSAVDLSKIRHDLRTPINHIIGYSEMLQEEERIPRSFLPDLEKILAGGRQCLQLINEYFDESKFSSTELNLQQVFHELRTPINHVIGYSEMLEEQAAETPGTDFISDLRKIRGAATTWLALMEKYLLPENVESAGNSFFPTAPATAGPQPRQESRRHLSQTENAALTPDAHGTLLVVDDDADNREILCRRLQNDGYTVAMAENGLKALELMGQQAFDLVLLDLLMPGMDGYQLLDRMKSDSELRHLPVIMISAMDQESGIARCIEMGAEDYLAKPFNTVFLRARIGACLDKKRLRDRERETYKALVKSQRALASELTEAAQYVRSLLPEPLTGDIRSRWCFEPSAQLGGDTFGHHWLDSDHLALFLVDVCGHGVGAALLSVSVMNVLRSQTLSHVDFRDPSAVLATLNATFTMEKQNQMFFTIWYGVYHLQRQDLIYSSGGHPPAILLTETSPNNPQHLRTAGAAIGCLEDLTYENRTTPIQSGSQLFVFSDGVYEIPLSNGKLWTLTEWSDYLVSRAQTPAFEPHAALRHVQSLKGCKMLDDDFSLLHLRF